MTFEEKTLKTERIYEGKIINLRRDEVTTVSGTSFREIVEHNGGAVIAAVTGQGKMVMVKQYRKPAGRVMLEAPAGKIDPGEDPRDAALRELEAGETSPDEGEAIDIEEMDIDELCSMALKGQINDAKTIIAIWAAKEAVSSGELL